MELGFELKGFELAKQVFYPLEPHLQSILFWLFWRWGLLSYLPRLVLNLNLTAYHC
jgi:hypothetical protein